MSGFLHEIVFAARRLGARPTFALAAIVTLAGAIAIQATLASAVSAMLLRPLPVDQPGNLVRLFATSEGRLDRELSWERFDLVSRAEVFDAVVGTDSFRAFVEAGGRGEQVSGELVTTNYFDGLGVTPRRGRAFLETEGRAAGDAAVAVISDRLAEKLFGGADPLGGRFEIGRTSFTVVGIAPPSFRGTNFALTREVWIPATMRAAISGRSWPGPEGEPWITALARLQAGTSPVAAEQRLNAAAERMGAAEGTGFRVLPERAGMINPEAPGAVRIAGAAAMAVGLVVLLIACANVVGLLVSRLATRGRELGIRIALGAGGLRLAREGMAEAIVLVGAGALGGALLAVWATRLLPALVPAAVTIDFSPDWRVAGQAALVSGLVVLVLSLIPVLHARRVDLVGLLRGTDRANRRRDPLSLIAASQAALTIVILVVASLFIGAMLRYQSLEPGFAVEGRAGLDLDLAAAGRSESDTAAVLENLRAALERSPAVRRTALASGLPLGHLPSTMELERGTATRPRVDFSAVGPGYFELMSIPLVSGREIEERDREGVPPVAIVNETFAARFGAGIGERIRIAGSEEPLVIVGIVRDSKVVSLTEAARPLVYRSIAQDRPSRLSLLVEGTGEIEGTLAAAREMAAEALGGHSIARAASLAEIVDADRRLSRIGALLATIAAAAGTLLTALALYAVLATTIARSRRDLAIRVAIGATPGRVVRAVAAIAARTILIGIVPGILAGWGAAAALGPLLGAESMRPIAFAAPIAILLLVAVVAAWGPARRALDVDPVQSLRNV